ncbi:hypothetical protein V8G54_030854 [Vigna mungo]|uniref:Small EDRK-rich factor-like N-terminal domain-containing protein n=1 Tax=Vigna mungo TaxID=3915 RepID=A0AAQ3RKH6_VIGMU
MGGGNGQKSKMARERNMEKNKASKGSQLEANKKAMNIQSGDGSKWFLALTMMLGRVGNTWFRTVYSVSLKHLETFICTTSEVKCREHAEAKHPKADVYTCFPHLKK